ncbi:MAG: UDP-N-acetylglucosamine--N-acetylmuramyl-(pentapeptide) pyrophosphoryl-undecaprenol N-acetylglucosamine transferase, partial [Bacteroidia bacterium]
DIVGKREEGLKFFKLDPKKQTLLVIGGSLGARTINEAIAGGLLDLEKNNIQLIWQTGKTYFEKARELTKKYSDRNIFAFDFISRMDLAYAAADIVISRAGASSVSELCNIGMACILVPSPNVAEDHQTKNAMALVNKNAAILVKDSEASDSLIKTSLDLLRNKEKQGNLKTNISSMAFHNSATLITNEVLKLANYHV